MQLVEKGYYTAEELEKILTKVNGIVKSGKKGK
jgi:hypothetical protein